MVVAVPNVATKHILYEKLGRLVHINIDELKSYQPTPAQVVPQSIKNEQIKIPRSTLSLLCALLLQNPKLQARVDPNTLSIIQSVPKTKTFIELIGLISSNNNITTALIIERWRQHPHFNLIRELTVWDTGIHKDGIEAETE